MPILQSQHAWRELDRWNQPCGRPTYRTAVLELATGLVAHGVAIAVAYDKPNMLWNAADPVDQEQLESLWSGLLLGERPERLIPCGSHEFFVVLLPTCSARASGVDVADRRNTKPAKLVGDTSLIEASHALLRLWDNYDDTGPVPLDDAIAALRTALTDAAASAAAETSPSNASPA